MPYGGACRSRDCALSDVRSAWPTLSCSQAWFHNTFMVFNRRSAANETRCALNVDDPPQAVAVPAVAPATVAAPATAAAPVVVTAEAMAAGR